MIGFSQSKRDTDCAVLQDVASLVRGVDIDAGEKD